MTLVDASALVAVLQAEPEAFEFIEFLETNQVSIPASALVETEILAVRRDLGSDFERLMAKLKADVIAFDDVMVPLAAEAFRQYGKGRHKAARGCKTFCVNGVFRKDKENAKWQRRASWMQRWMSC